MGVHMARPGMRKLSWFPPIGVSRAIFRAFSDDKDLVKTFFDLLKNTAITGAGFALLQVAQAKLSGIEAKVAVTVLALGIWVASLALIAQSTHHFGRTFRSRVARILYPEFASNPIRISQPWAEPRAKGVKLLRFASGFYVPATLRSFTERLLVMAFGYGVTALLFLTFGWYLYESVKKMV
jgi:hypothetical protein